MARNKLNLQIITPTRVVLNEEVESVTLRTTEGEMGVYYDHEPVVALLAYGITSYKIEGKQEKVTTMGGFAEVSKDKVVILTDASEFQVDIDLERASKAKERAQKRMSQQDMDKMRAEIALKKALVRINLKENK